MIIFSMSYIFEVVDSSGIKKQALRFISMYIVKRHEAAGQESVRFGGHCCQRLPAVNSWRDEHHRLTSGSSRSTPSVRPRTDSCHADRRRVCGCSLLLMRLSAKRSRYALCEKRVHSDLVACADQSPNQQTT